MTKFGRTYRIALDCGHTTECAYAEVKERQLFIGKQIDCDQCPGTEGEKPNDRSHETL